VALAVRLVGLGKTRPRSLGMKNETGPEAGDS
jgi:hypothetical protein